MNWNECKDVLLSGDMVRIRNYFTIANVKTLASFGRTSLHVACGYGTPDKADVVAHLLDCGADMEATCCGWTALYHVVCNEKPNCMRMLLSRGAVVEPTDWLGMTPLARAIDFGYHECASLLLDWGAQLSEVHANVTVPVWAHTRVAGREQARVAAIVLLGSRRKNRSTVLAFNAFDVIRLIAKIVWSTRADEAWQINL